MVSEKREAKYMLDVTTIDDGVIIDVKYSGSLHVEDEARVHATFSAEIERHGTVRMLGEFADIEWGRVEPAAILMDAKMVAFLPHMDKVAIVAPPTILRALVDLGGKLTPGVASKAFAPDERDAALEWLRGED